MDVSHIIKKKLLVLDEIFLLDAAGRIINELISKSPIHLIDSIITTAINAEKI